MKRILGLVLSLAAVGLMAAGTPGTLVERNTASSALSTLYTHSGAELQTDIKGSSGVYVYNGAASNIAISVKGTACGASTVDAFMVPASSGIIVDNVSIGKVICARSLSGSSISSGKIYSNAW